MPSAKTHTQPHPPTQKHSYIPHRTWQMQSFHIEFSGAAHPVTNPWTGFHVQCVFGWMDESVSYPSYNSQSDLSAKSVLTLLQGLDLSWKFSSRFRKLR